MVIIPLLFISWKSGVQVSRFESSKWYGTMCCADRLTSFIYLQRVIHLATEKSINRSRGHCCSLDVCRSTDTRLLGEVRVSAMAVSVLDESGFLPFSEDKREPSLAAGDGEATADARDVFDFLC